MPFHRRIPTLATALGTLLLCAAVPTIAAPGDVETAAIDFNLQETDGTWHSLSQYQGDRKSVV